MQAGSHRGLALLHLALDREERGLCGDNAEITTLPHFDTSPNVCKECNLSLLGFFFFHRSEMTVCAAAAMTVPSHFHPDKDRCLGMKC